MGNAARKARKRAGEPSPVKPPKQGTPIYLRQDQFGAKSDTKRRRILRDWGFQPKTEPDPETEDPK